MTNNFTYIWEELNTDKLWYRFTITWTTKVSSHVPMLRVYRLNRITRNILASYTYNIPNSAK